jgi:hypothetical protein
VEPDRSSTSILADALEAIDIDFLARVDRADEFFQSKAGYELTDGPAGARAGPVDVPPGSRSSRSGDRVAGCDRRCAFNGAGGQE